MTLHGFTTRQVSEICLVPLSKVYSLKKQLTEGFHFVETRSTSNTKLISFSTSALTAIELSYWMKVGIARQWSEQRLDAFRITSEWLAEVAA